MTKPDVKIKKLTLSYFRGAKGPIDLDLGPDCKSAAIFGHNGEGKSSFAQAVEWFLREKVDVLSGEGVDKKDVVNLGSKDTDETSVGVVFNNKNLNAVKAYNKATDKIKCNNSSSEFIEYIDSKACYDRIYLNHHSILWFLLQLKGQKRVEIAKIIGYEDIVAVRGTIASALRDLEKSSELSDMRLRISNNDGLMTREVYGEAVTDTPKLLEKSALFLKTLGLSDPLKTLEDLEKLITKAINYLPSEERAKKRLTLESIKTKVVNFKLVVDKIKPLKSWEEKYNALVVDKQTISKLTLSDFLKSAEKIVTDDKNLNSCPLCEQEIKDRDKFLKQIIDRYKKYVELRTQLSDLGTELVIIKEDIIKIEKEFSETITAYKENKIAYDEKLADDFINLLLSIRTHLSKQFDLREAIAVDNVKIEQSLVDIKKLFATTKVSIQSEIDRLAVTDDEKKKQEAFQKLIRGKDLVLANISYRKQVKTYEEQIAGMRIIDAQILALQNSSLKEVLNVLSADINKFFCFLNQKDKVKNVRLELKGEEGIEFNLDFYDYAASPPKKYLSESQQNSLGIALFLAAVKKFNKVNKFFILDDVLISFDRNYRMRLLELLETEFSDYQIILLTHEIYWYQIIRRKFPQWVLKEIYWSFDNGIQFKDEHPDWIENLGSKHKKGEKIGNELRIGMEGLLKELCINLEVRLPYRAGDENERRTIGELFPYLTYTLQSKKSPIKDDAHYKALEVSNFIVTCSSHDNPDLDSSADLGDTIEKLKKFRSLFLCSKMESVKKSLKIPGKDKISCKCGELAIDWKE